LCVNVRRLVLLNMQLYVCVTSDMLDMSTRWYKP
jgi:hypothetical protein